MAQFDSEGFGYFLEGFNRNRPVSPFHLADVNRMQSGLFRQRLLRHPALFAEFSNICPNLFMSLGGGHPLKIRIFAMNAP